MNIILAKRINFLRKEKQMTLIDLGKKTGISPATLSRYERGQTGTMTMNFIQSIAKALDTTVAYLLGLANDPAPNASPGQGTEVLQTFKIQDDYLAPLIPRGCVVTVVACTRPINHKYYLLKTTTGFIVRQALVNKENYVFQACNHREFRILSDKKNYEIVGLVTEVTNYI